MGPVPLVRVVGGRLFACRLIPAAGLLACLPLLGAQQSPLTEQQPPPQQQPPAQQQPATQQVPRFRAEAALVRVDAYVTTRGRAVEDLRGEDFELFEDGVRQKVETFEYVRRGRVMPGAVGASEGEAPGRLVVLFIDTYHLPWVDRERLERREVDKRTPQPMVFPVVLPPPVPDDEMLREALKETINRVVGEADRVAVITPDMWAAAPAFGDRKSVVAELGTRSLDAYSTGQRPPEWIKYEACFPNGPWIEPEMRVRFRLNRTFTALEELVTNLELMRDERKAVFLVTRGWDPPPRHRNYIDPRRGNWGIDDTVCSAERYALADKDFTVWLSRIVDDAKRANVAFYSMYAHPLITFHKNGPDIDEQTRRFERQWGNLQETNPNQTSRVSAEFAAIDRDRRLWHDTLTEVAKDTYGRAILKMEDFDSGLKQIVEDLGSYYLLGYYSTNRSRDAAWRKIAVNVKRKDVTVRARSGYRAVTAADTAAAAPRPEPVAPEVNAALSPLARFRTDVPFHLAAGTEWDGNAHAWRLTVIGEIDADVVARREWRDGWRSEFTIVTGAAQATAGAGGVSVKAGERAFISTYPTTGGLPPGEYVVRAKAFGADQDTVFEDRASITLPGVSSAQGVAVAGGPILSRKANSPKSVFRATADRRFTRREVLMVEVPVIGLEIKPSVRLIDRQGQARDAGLEPAVGPRNGGSVVSLTIPLSSVAPGDYVLEIKLGADESAQKVHVGFRIVP